MNNLTYYIERAARNLENCRSYPSKFIFRCNVCGDSQKSKKKRRGYLFQTNGDWRFFCHNCGLALPGAAWLKKYFNDIYLDYIRDSMKNQIHETPEIKKPEKPKEENLIKKYYSDCKMVSIIKDHVIAKDAVKLCEGRKLPKEAWSKFYVCISGSLKNRLIIPFYNKQNKIMFFTARKIYSDMSGPKYIMAQGNKYIYNIDFIDRNKPVILCEGCVDSLFIENSCALNGVYGSDLMKENLKGLDCYYLLDNDLTGRKTAQKLLLAGYKVFNWNKFLKYNDYIYHNIKDVNDIFMKTNRKHIFKFEELKDYFESSIYGGLSL